MVEKILNEILEKKFKTAIGKASNEEIYLALLEMTKGTSTSGKVMADLSGWTLTLTAEQRYPVREVQASIIPGLIGV